MEQAIELIFGFLSMCLVVAAPCIFLPRFVAAIFSAQSRLQMKEQWKTNTFLFVATIASIFVYFWAWFVWSNHRY